MIELNAAKGLGDALHLRAIVLHLLKKGEALTVYTGWKEVFAGLAVTVKPLHEKNGDENWHHAMACLHCRIKETGHLDMFMMCARQAGIAEPVELRIDWQPRNSALLERIRRAAGGKKLLVYQPLKKVANLNDALARPRLAAYNEFIAAHDEYFRVRIGDPKFLQQDSAPQFDMDLMGKTSIHDILDIGTITDMFFGECCFTIILAQALDKAVTCMFSRRAAESGRNFLMNLRPERIFHKPHLATAVWDE